MNKNLIYNLPIDLKDNYYINLSNNNKKNNNNNLILVIHFFVKKKIKIDKGDFNKKQLL